MITTFFLFKNITSMFIIIDKNCKYVNYNKRNVLSCKNKSITNTSLMNIILPIVMFA